VNHHTNITLGERLRWLFIVRLNITRHHLIQAGILILSAAAIYLVALPDGDPQRRWGYAIGLAAQPLWIWTTWHARQWGMLLLTFFYVAVWLSGVMRHFA